jgi:hypothetical protein
MMADKTGRKRLDDGADSIVYLLTHRNSVMKIYYPLMKQLVNEGKDSSLEKCLEIVQRYNSDTLKAQVAINSEWNHVPLIVRSIYIDGTQYNMKITVLPQGDLEILDGEVTAIGQKYIPNPHLDRIFSIASSSQNPFYVAMDTQITKVRQTLGYATQIMRNDLHIPLVLENKNVKPIFNKSHHTINMIVTDFADDLINVYSVKK